MAKKYHGPSSELQRAAEQNELNQSRMAHWRYKYYKATGHEPVRCLHPVITLHQAACIAANHECNQNRQRIQRYATQRIKGHLPTPPEAA